MKISELIYKLMNRTPKGVWVTIAIFIVIFGTTEIAITYELIAMIDMFGAETFVLLYVSGFLVLIERPVLYIKALYREKVLVPSWNLIQEDSRCLYFLIPNGTRVYGMCAILVYAFVLLLPDFPILAFMFRDS
jgi:hypothetical protein